MRLNLIGHHMLVFRQHQYSEAFRSKWRVNCVMNGQLVPYIDFKKNISKLGRWLIAVCRLSFIGVRNL